jgi:hypothetical protein
MSCGGVVDMLDVEIRPGETNRISLNSYSVTAHATWPTAVKPKASSHVTGRVLPVRPAVANPRSSRLQLFEIACVATMEFAGHDSLSKTQS